ncbi:YslB family protein [Sporosarcina saromensis]|uniref:YslB family protein n=1 Tax=Sporosarcina saromensis TaxID=359365 RepID=A0ABU4GBJ2_9BACL|nr:YslB family protein [Sporosarcina saromensis]MDW0112957.1 YslB family protein [Sporosarcina saromensis]
MNNDTTEQPTRLGYEIIRDHVLPTILGKHENEILYWAGKDIARKFPMFSTDELPAFFSEAGWGHLTFSSNKQPKDEAWLILQQPDLTVLEKRSYQLEAGFLAEQFQKLNGYLAECYAEKQVKKKQIHFIVKWDTKTTV